MKENMYAENFVLTTRYRYAREDAWRARCANPCALIEKIFATLTR
jgi:hypothetical protein